MSVIYIENAGVRAGILPEVGGRIVDFRRIGGENVLKSDPALWDEPASERLVPTPSLLDFKAYNGHEVWVGPQSQWWKQQELNPEKRESTLFWPPDPYISFGSYKTVYKNKNCIILQSETSPLSAISFEKSIFIDEKGKLTFSVTMKNSSDRSVDWDIWLITRVGGHNLNFAPVADEKDVTLGEPSHDYQGRVTYKVEEGFFSFTPLDKSKEFEECTGKAYLKTDTPLIASLCGDELLTLSFEHHSIEEIHPEQSEIELYNFAHAEEEKSLLELEYHTPYYHLEPGDEVSTTSHWQLFPMKGKTEKEIRKFLTTFANKE